MSEEKTKTESVTICALGKTGDGKSTMLNRFCGDRSKKGNKGPFKSGIGTTSVTQSVQRWSQPLQFKESELANLNRLMTNLIDTPGLADSEGNDKKIVDKVKQFFEASCNGVNVFTLLFNVTNVRYDTNVQNLLSLLSLVFGDGFWKHVMLVFVRHDMDSDGDYINEDEYKNAIKEYPLRIQKQFKLEFKIGVTGFGKNNFCKGIKDIISFAKKKGKFVCEYMKTWEEAGGVGNPEQRRKEKEQLLKQVFDLSKQIENIEKRRKEEIIKHNKQMEELKKIQQENIKKSKLLLEQEQKRRKELKELHVKQMEKLEKTRLEQKVLLEKQIKQQRERMEKNSKEQEKKYLLLEKQNKEQMQLNNKQRQEQQKIQQKNHKEYLNNIKEIKESNEKIRIQESQKQQKIYEQLIISQQEQVKIKVENRIKHEEIMKTLMQAQVEMNNKNQETFQKMLSTNNQSVREVTHETESTTICIVM